MKCMAAFILAFLLLLTSCSYSLEEADGAFLNPGYVASGERICTHRFLYDMATNHDPYGIYPNSEFHFIQCENRLYGGECDFQPTFERHTRTFSGFENRTVILYNGRYYHVARFSCSVCGSVFAGNEYVLCTDNSPVCGGDCAGVLGYTEDAP